MRDNLVETLVGTIVVVIAAVFLYFAYRAAEVRGTAGYVLSAEFDRVDGLATGSDVRLKGIKVGTVLSQKLDTDRYIPIVQMVINRDVELLDDTSAKITSDGLFGSQYIALTPGGIGDPLGDGDAILYTQGSIDLIGLIAQAIFSADTSE